MATASAPRLRGRRGARRAGAALAVVALAVLAGAPAAGAAGGRGPGGVVRSARAVVVGTAPPAELAELAADADAAARTVDAVWGRDWPRTTVVLAPGSAAELGALLGRPAAGLAGLAGAAVGGRVVVSPTAFAALSPLGRRVVLAHELVHVAAGARGRGPVPGWLAEGWADAVADAGTGLTAQQVAGPLLASVAASGPPAALPSDAAFAGVFDGAGEADDAYAGAWVAVQGLVHRCGTAGVVRLYRSTAASTAAPAGGGAAARERAVDAALPAACGTDRAHLVAAWRADLVRLAAGGAGGAGGAG